MRRNFNEFLTEANGWLKGYSAMGPKPSKEPPPVTQPPKGQYDIFKDYDNLGKTDDPMQWVLDSGEFTEVDFENGLVEFEGEGDGSWTLYHDSRGELYRFYPEGY